MTRKILMALIVSGCTLVGCRTEPRQASVQQPTTETDTPAVAIVTDTSTTGPESTARHSRTTPLSWSAFGIPGSTRAASKVWVEKGLPKQVLAQHPFEYVLRITNIAGTPLSDVTATEFVPDGLRILRGVPAPSAQVDTIGGTLFEWSLGTLEVDMIAEIRLEAAMRVAGQITTVASADYRRGLESSVTAVQPILEIERTHPAQSSPCEEAQWTYIVRNRGNGPAVGLVIEEELPPGATAEGHGDRIRFESPTLAAGETLVLPTRVRASATGVFLLSATARSNDGFFEVATGRSQWRVEGPKLETTLRGPQAAKVGEPMKHSVVVKNDGNAIAARVKIELKLPDGYEVRSPDGSDSQVIRWVLGELLPAESRTLHATLVATTAGLFEPTVTTHSECGNAEPSQLKTQIRGLANLSIEVIDTNDPVRVGECEVYTIHVTNGGSAEATGVLVACTLEESMKYVSSSGPTLGGAPANRRISFEPLPRLASGATTKWTLVVRAEDQAEAHLSVTVDSDQSDAPHKVAETTEFLE